MCLLHLSVYVCCVHSYLGLCVCVFMESCFSVNVLGDADLRFYVSVYVFRFYVCMCKRREKERDPEGKKKRLRD